MLQNIDFSNAALLSSCGTSAHETGTDFPFALTGNPYYDFARMGMDLHDFRIRMLGKTRPNRVRITGTFNICGIGYTAGAADYPSLLREVHARFLEKKAWHRQCRDEKKMRNTLAYINRHPDATVLPAWLC